MSEQELTASLEAFVAHLQHRPHHRPHLGDGEVEVQPGGGKFKTITDALQSITDASQHKEYTVYAGPGVFEEGVTCKSWVFIEGSGPDQTTVRSPLGITGASNSSIGDLTVDGGPTAVNCIGTINFAIANCTIISSDQFESAIRNYEAVSVDFNSPAPTPSSLSISYSTVQATTRDTLSVTVGVVAGANSVVLLNYCKTITAKGGGTQMGCVAGTGGSIRLYDCNVSSPLWALRLLDEPSSIIATSCTIDGKVSPGVIIK